MSETLRQRNRRRGLAASLAAACTLLAVPWAGAVGNTLLDHFASGRFTVARTEIQDVDVGDSPAGSRLLTLLLTEDPGQAEALMGSLSAGGKEGKKAWSARAALEEADLAYARHDFAAALTALEPLLGGDSETLPGVLHLRAGLACRALGRLQKAREMLASIRPDDPAFGRARFYLGDIALEQGDPDLALRYFDGAARSLPSGDGGAVAQARWRALNALDRRSEADDIMKEFKAGDGGGLSWLAAVAPVRTSEAPAETTFTVAPATGRFCLQWAAFRDRSLALDFVRDNRERIPDLRIVPGTGADGITLYRVRSGSFNDPQEARRKAAELADALHLEVLVTENE